MILLVESGATKSDWRKVDQSGKLVSRHLLAGMNVSTVDIEFIRQVLSDGIAASGACADDSFYMYTAGVVTEGIRDELQNYILSRIPFREIDIQSDLVGAARSVLGRNKGITAIMGTGSNSCFYDGESVRQKVMSGGYILGDDGSGAALGRMFLTDFIKNLIPEEVAADFASKFDASYSGIVENVYRSAAPSAYLGSLAPFILSHYDNSYIREMVDTNFRRFIDRSLKCYDTAKYPVGIVGGFGYACRDIFSSLCLESAVTPTAFLPEPIEGLIKYHTQNL